MWPEAPSRAESHSAPDANALAAALQSPEAYPENPPSIELRETHISWVFLTPTHAYKLKKPVKFSFLDFSTPRQREVACWAELTLNRRLAPDVYIDVWPIRRTSDGGVRVGPGRGEVLDHVVVMRRLPEHLLMHHRLATGTVTAADIRRVAQRLASFYRTARRDETVARYATPASIRANVADNLEQLLRWPDVLGCGLLRRLESAQLQFPALYAAWFERRIGAGWVCEGHGDLRPEHICLSEPPVAFDCVEFALAFRAGDVLNDVAFLAMELEYEGREDLARCLLETLEDEYPGVVEQPLLAFYKAYRALVRAKVSLLRAAQEQQPAARRRHWAQAVRYAELAARYDADYHRPFVLAIIGPSGTGKTTLAYELARTLGAPVLRSDVVRQRLTRRREPQAGYESGIYRPEVTKQVYRRLVAEAIHWASVHRTTVLVDATFAHRARRQQLRTAARSAGVPCGFLYCRLPAHQAARRVVQRLQAGTDISDARPDIVSRQYENFALAPDLARSDVVAIDTATPVHDATQDALAAIRRLLRIC